MKKLLPAVAIACALLCTPAAALAQVATATVPINIAAAAATELIPGVVTAAIRVTHWDVIAGGTGNFTFAYADAGSNCATNRVNLTGPYNLTAQAGDSVGGGYGWILITPGGKALCAVTSAAVQMSGSLSYAQN